MHEKTVARVYFRELGGALLIYGTLLVASIVFGRAMAPGMLRTVVLLSPMIGFALAAWAIARHLGRIDEYQRLMTLENLAIAAATTAGLSFSYGFMETAGYPKLSMFSVWVVMGASWFVVQFIRCRWPR
ncbi:hypothetical protein KY495_21275 [Massilia sp. PAMC28688]|uniref:hypothetical protein n=1 Tax=Massilia sp. PAMC28688 TaxID=2861283 RepID=UPI001C628AA8|nr:hypothetical protein [Massilia sp. PAMC28688]QYF93186.1 hypothetical protein KY495_21275 [Massilia sp. PAMC28688]